MALTPLVGKQRTSTELANARINLWEGSVRSSKTISSLLRWVQYVIEDGPPGNLAMIGKTERTLKRNIIDPLIEMLGTTRCKYNQGEGELWICGRRIYVAGANDAKAEDKIRGLTLAGAYVDEVSVIPEGFWAMLLTRLSVEGAKVFGTTNPDSPVHWLMKNYLKRAKVWLRHDGTVVVSDDPTALDLVRMSFNLRDNPNLSPAYVAALEAEFTGLWRKRFIQGLWVLAEGAVYDSFDPEPGKHVIRDTPTDVEAWVVAIDYGTTNPFVALLIAVCTDRLVIAREWRWDSKERRRQLTDAQYSARLREWLDELDPPANDIPSTCPGARTPTLVVVDPSAASFIAQLYTDGWSGVRGAKNAVDDGLRTTNTLLAGGRLQIHESCTGLIEEKAGYVWDPEALKRGVEQPLKIADHGPDAERYGCMGTRRWWRRWVSVPLPDVDDEDEAA